LRKIALCSSNDRPQTAASRAVAELIGQIVDDALAEGSWQYARLLERAK
jgi:hypothetical protein